MRDQRGIQSVANLIAENPAVDREVNPSAQTLQKSTVFSSFRITSVTDLVKLSKAERFECLSLQSVAPFQSHHDKENERLLCPCKEYGVPLIRGKHTGCFPVICDLDSSRKEND